MRKASIYISFVLVFIGTLALVHHKNQKAAEARNKAVELNQKISTVAPDIIEKSIPYIEDITYDVNMANPERESITFIMKDDENQLYYQAATKHYHLHPSTENETLVETCNSILSIIDYLHHNASQNGEPWGKINIVKYNEDWKGIQILTEEERNTSKEILSAMELQQFNPLGDHIVDANTEIMVEGTGIGNNIALIELIAQAFGGNDYERPIVRSSKFIHTFDATETESRKYLTESFFGFFPSSDALTNEAMIPQFQNNYPNQELDWEDALDRLEPRFAGDTYSKYQYDNDLTTVSIFRALTIENNEAPYTPLPFEADINDTRFFSSSRSAELISSMGEFQFAPTATPKNYVLQ